MEHYTGNGTGEYGRNTYQKEVKGCEDLVPTVQEVSAILWPDLKYEQHVCYSSVQLYKQNQVKVRDEVYTTGAQIY